MDKLLMLGEKRKRGGGCDATPLPYTVTCSPGTDTVQSGKTYSFKAYINMQASAAQQGREREGKTKRNSEKSVREHKDKFLNFRRAHKRLSSTYCIRVCAACWLWTGPTGWDQGHIWTKNGGKPNL